MNDVVIPEANQAISQPDSKPAPTFRDKILNRARKVVAITLWLYFVTKIFAFDIDTYLVQKIESDALAMEWFLRSEFRITTMDEAIAELERLKTGMLGVVSWLTRSTTKPR